MRVIPFPTCDGSTGTDRHVLERDVLCVRLHVKLLEPRELKQDKS